MELAQEKEWVRAVRVGAARHKFLWRRHRRGQQDLSGACASAQLGGDICGIAHEGECGALGRSEDPDGQLSAIEPNADADLERVLA